MDELQKLLGDELFNQLIAKLNGKELFLHDKGAKVLVDDGSLIPKYRIDEINEQKKTLQAQLDQHVKDLTELKKTAGASDEMKVKIEELQEASKIAKADMEKREISITKSFAVKEALLNSGVSDSAARDILAKNFSLDEIEIYAQGENKGKIKGFDEMLKPYKENKSFAGMFAQPDPPPGAHKPGSNGNGEVNPWSKKTLNLAEQVRITRQDPAKAQALREAADK